MKTIPVADLAPVIVGLPDIATPASELTEAQISRLRRELPAVDMQFVSKLSIKTGVEVISVARAYDAARELLIKNYVGSPGKGEFTFDPKLYAKAVEAFDAMLAIVPMSDTRGPRRSHGVHPDPVRSEPRAQGGQRGE